MNELLLALALMCQSGYEGASKVRNTRACVAEVFKCINKVQDLPNKEEHVANCIVKGKR